MSGPFYQGQTVMMSVVLTDETGATVDPPEVKLRIRPPGRPDADYLYTLSQLERTGTGAYRVFVLLDAAGTWKYRWIGNTSPNAVDGESFVVRPDDLKD